MLDIACFGTSLTWVYQWQPELVRLIEAQGVPATAYNLGASGQNSGWGDSNVQRVARLRPQFALVEFSMNDCAVMTVSAAQANTISILNALKATIPPANIFLMTMNPTVGSGALATARATLPSYYTNYRALAVSQGVGLIDLAATWATAYIAGDIPDGVHPTAAADRRVTAATIATTLLAAI